MDLTHDSVALPWFPEPEAVGQQDMTHRELLRYSYQHLAVATLGSAGAALVVATVVGRDGWNTRLSIWLCLHGLMSVFGLYASVSYRTGRLHQRPVIAGWARRALSLGFGALWGLGGLWWSSTTQDSGLCLLLCAAGMSAASTSTSSADPSGLLLFTLPTFAPWLLLGALDRGWLSVLLLLYLTAITVVSYRNQKLLKTSFSLRWENTQLLERALAERAVAESAQRRAEAAVASRTRFFAAASHDLRQPVQALSLFADVLKQEPDAVRRNQAISSVERTSQVLSTMLESLLDVARLDTGSVTASPRNIALRRLLDDTAVSLREDITAQGLLLRTVGPECYASADPVLLGRVVQDLLLNALRHARRGRVLLAVRRRSDHCLIQVWDQGHGIAPEDERRIFEDFVQLDNPHRDRRRGLGLGLSMVQRICDMNGWPITLRTRVGHGSVFTIRLPRAVFPEVERDAQRAPPQHTDAAGDVR